MRAKVVCLRPKHDFDRAKVEIPESFNILFFPQYDEKEVGDAVADADFILAPSHNPPITAKLIDRAKSLKMIQLCGSGYEKVDLKAASRAGVLVARSAGQNSQAVAQLAFVLMTMLNRGIMEADREIKKGNYQAVREKLRKEGTYELENLNLGIVGVGPMGKEMARIGAFFGARLFYFDILRLSADQEKEMKLTFTEFDELLKISDVLTLHVPLNAKTKNMIGRRELSMMKKSAVLINTSRGALIDEEALMEALKARRLKGAALDVFDPEPLPADHPFLSLAPEVLDRLIMTPHLGGTTKQSQNRMFQEAINNILLFMKGDVPKYVVNAEQLQRK